jgi:hypothetical protein
VPGYSGAEELLLLRDEGLRLEPDVVVLGFFWNDVMGAFHGSYARFELDGGALRFVPPSPASPEHPFFARERRRQARRTGLLYTLASHSYTWRFLSDRLKLLHLMLDDLVGSPEVQKGADPAELEPAWQLSFALIREMRRLSEEHGARFLLVAIPDQAQLEPDVELVGSEHHMLDVQRRLAELAAAEGIAYFDPLPRLGAARAQDATPYYYRYDRHWNALGQRRAGEALDAELRALGWLPAR